MWVKFSELQRIWHKKYSQLVEKIELLTNISLSGGYKYL
jgi:hypothetical protein